MPTYRGSCQGRSHVGRYRVNLGCLHDFDPLAVAVTLIDGKSF